MEEYFKKCIKIIFGLSLFWFSRNILASDNVDLLAGTTGTALQTLNGAGRHWIYIIDGALSLGAFAKTKNPLVFASVLAAALGTTFIVNMAGGS